MDNFDLPPPPPPDSMPPPPSSEGQSEQAMSMSPPPPPPPVEEEAAPMIHPSRLRALGLSAPAATPPPEPTSYTAVPPPAAPMTDRVSGYQPSGDRDRERDSRRDRDSHRTERGSSRGRDKERERRHRRSRSKSKGRSDRERDRERRGSRERDRERDHSSRSRRRSRSRSRENRERSRHRSKSPRKDGEKAPQGSRRWPSRFWDVPPPGYAHIQAIQYKAMLAAGQIPATAMISMIPGLAPVGMFVRDGEGEAPGTAPPSITLPLDIGTIPPMPIQPLLVNQQITRGARRLYLGNIPFGVSDAQMMNFFNEQMQIANLCSQPGYPVLNVQINHEKNFAFVEFRSVDECTNCLAFDGVMYMNQALKIRRPKDYVPIPGQVMEPPRNILVPGVVSTMVPDSEHKIFVGGLPTYLTEDQVKELLSAFGPLRAFNLVRDPMTNASKGYAFFEFVDSHLTDDAITGLHDMSIGDKRLVVQRASHKDGTMPAGLSAMMGIATPTTVLVLLNMVVDDELKDDEEYEDILDDIRDECGKYGKVESLRIPRPQPDVVVPGVGKVFIEFSTMEEAMKAQQALSGRKFANRTVVTSYLEPSKYEAGDLD